MNRVKQGVHKLQDKLEKGPHNNDSHAGGKVVSSEFPFVNSKNRVPVN